MDETQEQITARIVQQTADATAKALATATREAASLIAKENTASSTAIAVLQNEMTSIKNQQTSFESEMNRKMDGLSPKFEKLFTKLEEIALGRPTWAVTIIIGILASVCTGLIAFTLSNL